MLRLIQTLSLFMFCMTGLANMGFAEAPAHQLEFRVAADAEASGWQKMELPDSKKPIYVSDSVTLSGDQIEKVSFYPDANGRICIGFSLAEEGAKVMESATSQNHGKRLAILLNGKVVSAPSIRATITKEGEITGRFDDKELLSFFHALVLTRNKPAASAP